MYTRHTTIFDTVTLSQDTCYHRVAITEAPIPFVVTILSAAVIVFFFRCLYFPEKFLCPVSVVRLSTMCLDLIQEMLSNGELTEATLLVGKSTFLSSIRQGPTYYGLTAKSGVWIDFQWHAGWISMHLWFQFIYLLNGWKLLNDITWKKSAAIHSGWISLAEAFICMKKAEFALPSTFVSPPVNIITHIYCANFK